MSIKYLQNNTYVDPNWKVSSHRFSLGGYKRKNVKKKKNNFKIDCILHGRESNS